MNFTLTYAQLAGLSHGTAKRDAVNPNATSMMAEEFAADFLGAQREGFTVEQADAQKQAMGAHDRLMAPCSAVMAQADKLNAIEGAVKPILNLP